MARERKKVFVSTPKLGGSDWATDDVALKERARAGVEDARAASREASEGEVAQEILARQADDPMSLFVPHPGAQSVALRSNIRGVLYLSGGNQYGKTFCLAWKSYLVASQRHQEFCCPVDCPQFGVGSCGVHCCPQPSMGGADYRAKGCAAGEPRACPIHIPLRYPGQQEIIIGCKTLPLLWSNFYWETLTKFLPKTGLLHRKPTWEEDRKGNQIIDKNGKWKYVFIPYAELSHWVGRKATFVGLDELPENRGIFTEAQARANTRGGQVMLAATAIEVAEGKALWIADQIRRRHDPTTRVQYVEGPTHENPYTDVERLIDASRAWTDQERDIRLLGKLNFLQDSSVFNTEIIEIQSRFVRDPKRAWVVGNAVDGQAVAAYFQGPTVYPPDCELKDYERRDLALRRGGSGNGGVSCYDCPPELHCKAFRVPPRVSFDRGALPTMTLVKPADAAVERHPLMVWTDPDPLDRYVLGADCALGGSTGDYNVASVFSYTTGEQVLQYRERSSPHIFAAVLAGIYYGGYKPFMVVERNGYGAEVLTRLMMDYLVPSSAIFHRQDTSVRMPSGYNAAMAGYVTTAGSKSLGSSLELPFGRQRSPLESLRTALRTRRMIIRSPYSLSEYQTYCRIGDGKLGALSGCHDDCVTADMLGAFALERKNIEFSMPVANSSQKVHGMVKIDPATVDSEPLPWQEEFVDLPWQNQRSEFAR